MPSRKEIELFQLYSRLAARSCYLGIDIIPSNCHLIPTSSTIKRAVHYSTAIWLTAMIIFCFYRNFVVHKAGSNELIDIALEIIYFVLTGWYSTAGAWLMCFIVFKDDLIKLWNQLLEVFVKGNLMLYILLSCYWFNKHLIF